MRPGHHEERVGPTTEHRNSIHAPRNPKLARNSGARTFCDAPKRCNSNDVISKLEIRVGELRATFLRNHSSVPHSGVVLPNRCNACGALLPRLFLCLGGIATIGLRHAGDTPSRGFYGSKTPRCAAGLCGGLSVLCSTCSPPRPDAPKQGCLGRSGRRFERRFAMLGACRRASSAWSAWLASSVRGVAGPGVNRCRVQKGGTPQGPASNDAISPVGRC